MPHRVKEPYAIEPRKLPSGRWKGRVVRYDLESGKRHELTQTFETKKEAKNWAETEAANYRNDPNRKPPTEETVTEFLDQWFPQMLSQRSLRPTSIARYRADMDHIKRLVGSKPLKDLTPMDIQAVYAKLLEEGLSPNTVRHVRVILHGALGDAVTWDVLAKDPLRGTKPPKSVRREFQLPSPEDARALLQVAQPDRLYALWVFLALTGCRRGEALALKWDDIDWERKSVTIQRTQSGWGANRSVHPPKTASGRRVVALSDYLIAILLRHREQQNVERGAAGVEWHENGWVFTTRRGTWFAGGHIYDYFKRLVEQAGLPDSLRPHDLRHAMASYWLAEGVPIKVVSERLGHSNISITLDIYGHLLPHMQAEAADKMDAFLLPDIAIRTQTFGPQTGRINIKKSHDETK